MTALLKGEPRVFAPLYRRIPWRREAVRPYNRLPYLRLILALSFRASAHTGVGIRPPPFSCLRRGTFALGGKSTQKRRSNLRFENPLRAFTQHLSRWCSPRERCAVEISPKCCIVSASLSAAAFALKSRAVWFFVSWQDCLSNSGQRPPPTFAALRQRRDLIIA